jgi:signal transduction histidine kinase
VHVGSNTYVVVVGTRLETVDNAVDRVEVGLAIAGGPLVLLAGIAAWVVAGAALAPVERMRRQVAGMSEEDIRGNMAVPRTRDELAHLAATMNDLLGRVRDARERERRFVAEAGHELRTPLAILRGELELANRPGRSREELTEAVTVAGEETDRLVRLAEDLLFLARGDAAGLDLRGEEVVLGEVVGRAVEASSGRAAERGVSIDIDVDPDSVAWVDADRLRQSIDNLLDNALQFSPSGGHVAVRAGVSEGRMRLEVVDDGPGFPIDFLPHAFERFARADESRAQGRGSGLGLAIVASIASAHGGTVSAGVGCPS